MKPDILQTETIDLSDENNKSDRGQRMFRRSNVDKSANSVIDSDGLPYIGQVSLFPSFGYIFNLFLFIFSLLFSHS